MDTKIFRSMSYGVYIVTTLDGGRPVGCIANSIMQITSSPATVAVSINHDNYTNACMEREGRFAFHILGEQSDPSLIGRFGFQSGRDTDKFAGLDYETKDGLPIVKGVCGYVTCKIIQKMETSTHTVFLGEVTDAGRMDDVGRAMSYAYYHEVLKGKSPSKAPTYLPEEPAAAPEQKAPAASRYVCQVCGYVYEGETLPEGFTCPICHVGAERFTKQ